MKKILTLLAILSLISCSKDNDEILEEQKNVKINESENQSLQLIEKDNQVSSTTSNCFISGVFSNTNVTFEDLGIFGGSYWEFSWDFAPGTPLRLGCDYSFFIELNGKSGQPPYCLVPSPNNFEVPYWTWTPSSGAGSYKIYDSELNTYTNCFRYRFLIKGEDCINIEGTYDCITYSPWYLYQP